MRYAVLALATTVWAGAGAVASAEDLSSASLSALTSKANISAFQKSGSGSEVRASLADRLSMSEVESTPLNASAFQKAANDPAPSGDMKFLVESRSATLSAFQSGKGDKSPEAMLALSPADSASLVKAQTGADAPSAMPPLKP